MNFWDEKYSEVGGYKYGTQANAFLMEQVQNGFLQSLGSGARILLPGDGEGRNSVWLAEQGFACTSVDSSRIGLDKAQQLAKERGVEITTIHADLLDWPAPTEQAQQFDAVVSIYFHLPSSVRPTLHQKLAQSLRPSGLILLEAFTPQQLSYQATHHSGGPKDVDMLYTLVRLQQDWSAQLEPLYASEQEVLLSEGEGHAGLAHVLRFVAKRLAQPQSL